MLLSLCVAREPGKLPLNRFIAPNCFGFADLQPEWQTQYRLTSLMHKSKRKIPWKSPICILLASDLMLCHTVIALDFFMKCQLTFLRFFIWGWVTTQSSRLTSFLCLCCSDYLRVSLKKGLDTFLWTEQKKTINTQQFSFFYRFMAPSPL